MIPAQDGRTFVITGANTGIGRVTAESLASAGARLILAGRSEARHADVLRTVGPCCAAFVPLDLGSLDSVRSAAAAILASGEPIHGLINNAGLAGSRGLTQDGFELTFGVNHLGPYLLTRLLLDALVENAPARVVNVSSRAHLRARGIPFEALRSPTASRTGLPEYSVSKLANVLFTKSLVARYGARGLAAFALHPGVVATDIWRSLPGPVEWVIKQFMITAEQGAATTLHCATARDLEAQSGAYFDKCRPVRENRLASDVALADELWSRSAAWCGLPA